MTERAFAWMILSALSLIRTSFPPSHVPTEEDTSTQGTDASTEAHQTQQDGQDDSSSEQSADTGQSKSFDARKAFDSTNAKVNKLADTLKKIDPEVIAQIAEKLGVTTKEAEKKVESDPENPDVKAIVQGELWNNKNAERIADANKNGKFDAYLKDGIKPDLALRLAEQDEGIKVDTSAQTRQRRVSAGDHGIDRDMSPEVTADEKSYGITADDKKKYGNRAKNVQVIR